MKEVLVKPTWEWGWFAGALIGDGALIHHKRSRSRYISLSSTVRDGIVAQFFESGKRLNLNPIWLEYWQSKRKNIRAYRVIIYSKILYEFFRPYKLDDFRFDVPPFIYQTEDALRGFLQGFFDAEGTVYLNDRERKYAIQASSKHKESLKKIKECLKLLDINSTIRSTGTFFTLAINNYLDRKLFSELVSFRLDKKKKNS